MKILYTPPRFYPYIGGVENYALGLAKKLSNDNDVEVVCANEPKSNLSNINGVHVKRLISFFKIANTNITFLLPIRLLKIDFDIIHSYLPTPWSADISAIIAKLKNKPFVLSYCNDLVGKSLLSKIIIFLYNHTLLRLTLFLADKIIIIGPDYLKHSRFLQPFQNKVTFEPIGIDTNKFLCKNFKKNKNSLLFISILDKFHTYKGLDDLLRAIEIVKKTIPDIMLTIGGKGDMIKYYKQAAKNLQIENNVNFVGFISDDQLVDFYNRHGVFVLPSNEKQEGFGIVLLEALACGTPVITTNLVGIANDIRNTNCGIVIKSNNVNQLAKSIIGILVNQKLYNNFLKNIPSLIKKYELIKTTDRIKNIYRQLIKD